MVMNNLSGIIELCVAQQQGCRQGRGGAGGAEAPLNFNLNLSKVVYAPEQ